MNEMEAKNLTDDVFKAIENALSLENLKNILNEFSILQKYVVNEEKYPKIKFTITRDDIDYLVEHQYINSNFAFTQNISEKISDPLTKLLYALAWKNGDLSKIHHILKGISNTHDNEYDKDAVVFHEFGKYLRTPQRLIIDQHVIRAFNVFCSQTPADVMKWQRLTTVNKEHNSSVRAYYLWYERQFGGELRSIEGFAYYIDKILFALGKAIKIKKQKNFDNLS